MTSQHLQEQVALRMAARRREWLKALYWPPQA
jgi:hypothetical protein